MLHRTIPFSRAPSADSSVGFLTHGPKSSFYVYSETADPDGLRSVMGLAYGEAGVACELVEYPTLRFVACGVR